MRRLLSPVVRLTRSIPVTLTVAISTLVVVTGSVAIVATAGGSPTATLAAVPTIRTPAPWNTQPPSATPEPTPTASPEATAGSGGGAPIAVTNPAPGSGQWEYAGGGPTFGSDGPLSTYRVAVEVGLPVSVAEFTALVDAALGDPRGWTGGGRRFQRVSGGSNFTVYLASPWTAYGLCASVVDIRIGGVPYTNCQAGAPVVINSDRYLQGASRFTGSLDVYRRYAINHEVGHRLGFGHVPCPGAGQLAPVMQQQTLGLNGCQPNAWPFPGNPAPPEPPPTTEPPITESPIPEPTPEPSPPTTTEPAPTTEPPTTEASPPPGGNSTNVARR